MTTLSSVNFTGFANANPISSWSISPSPAGRARSAFGVKLEATRGRGGIGMATADTWLRMGEEIESIPRNTAPGKDQSAVLSLEPLQEWEGYVTEVSEGTFSARLVDVTAGKKVEDEAADFPISDLSEDELSLLKEGAVFRWIIGYQRTKFGQKIRTSQIVFRRLPAWSKLDIRQARAEARELASGLLWD